MESKTSAWEQIFDCLHCQGWSLGLKAYHDQQQQLTWVVDGHQQRFHLMSEDKNLTKAFLKLYNLILAMTN